MFTLVAPANDYIYILTITSSRQTLLSSLFLVSTLFLGDSFTLL